ncbi:cell division protein ZapA [Pseudomonas lalucatii]|nr:cell division protein ZapA [Pseudomonas lalucatii]
MTACSSAHWSKRSCTAPRRRAFRPWSRWPPATPVRAPPRHESGGEAVSVISVLGNDYSIKAPVGKQQALKDSAQLLKSLLAETKAASPSLMGDRLLVLTALKLCAQQLELEQRHRQDIEHLEERVSTRVAGIAGLIRRP